MINPKPKIAQCMVQWWEVHGTINPHTTAPPCCPRAPCDSQAHLELLHHAYFGPEGVFKGQFEDKEVARQVGVWWCVCDVCVRVLCVL